MNEKDEVAEFRNNGRTKGCLEEPLVSIVTPVYNCEEFIADTIKSVLAQTYQNWEMLIVDDVSVDKTAEIVKSYASKDARIKYLKLSIKGGASIARNTAINNANGDYIAFLDGDDLWLPDKLKKQIYFMEEKKCVFTYSNYYVIQRGFEYEKSDFTGLLVKRSPKKLEYNDLVKWNRIGCLTVIYNLKKIGKVNIPRLDKRNDYALWLKILSRGYTAYLYDEPLAIYRNHQGISKGNKARFIKYHYEVFRNVMKYGKLKSSICVCRNIFFYFMLKANCGY